MARRRPKRGDVFQIPAGDDRVAYGQVLSEEEGVFMHLVVFEGCATLRPSTTSTG